MKAKELQVGNFVNIPRNNGEPVYYKIVKAEETDNFELLSLGLGQHKIRAIGLFLEPILITSGILIRNGFKRYKETDLYQYDKDGVHIGYDFGVKSCSFCKSHEYDIAYKEGFSYVHQLQQMLQFLKINKEIILQ